MQVPRYASLCLFTRIVTRAVILASVFTSGVPVLAMSVSPVYLDMAYTGSRSRADIRVVNRYERALPIEAVVSRVTHASNGTEAVQRDSEDFLVLPMQAMIPPGGSQILTVQWLGDPLIEESRAYRISINQLPVAQPGANTAVQIVMNLTVAVNVAPPLTACHRERNEHGAGNRKQLEPFGGAADPRWRIRAGERRTAARACHERSASRLANPARPDQSDGANPLIDR